jgi:hypothetical protein
MCRQSLRQQAGKKRKGKDKKKGGASLQSDYSNIKSILVKSILAFEIKGFAATRWTGIDSNR